MASTSTQRGGGLGLPSSCEGKLLPSDLGVIADKSKHDGKIRGSVPGPSDLLRISVSLPASTWQEMISSMLEQMTYPMCRTWCFQQIASHSCIPMRAWRSALRRIPSDTLPRWTSAIIVSPWRGQVAYRWGPKPHRRGPYPPSSAGVASKCWPAASRCMGE